MDQHVTTKFKINGIQETARDTGCSLYVCLNAGEVRLENIDKEEIRYKVEKSIKRSLEPYMSACRN